MFIVIEGTDGSGKGTQTKLLVDYMLKKKKKVQTFDFPRYANNSFAKMAGRALNSEFGDLSFVPPYYLVLPYMIDQYLAHRELRESNEKNDFVICNRYVTTNFAYMAARIPNQRKRREFRAWLAKAAFEDLKMAKPDLVIVLYVPIEIAQKLLKLKAKRNYLKGNQRKDLHERNLKFQEEVAKCYKQMVKEKPEWKMVNCVDKKGNLKTIEEIHREIVGLVEKC